MKPKQSIPAGWIWLYWLDPSSYSLYGLVTNQLGDVTTLTQLPEGSVPPAVPVSQFVESYFGFQRSFMVRAEAAGGGVAPRKRCAAAAAAAAPAAAAARCTHWTSPPRMCRGTPH